jgi:hypothetical protein
VALATELCAAEMDRNSTCAAGIIAVAGPYCFVAFQPPFEQSLPNWSKHVYAHFDHAGYTFWRSSRANIESQETY